MGKLRILVADDDPWILKMVTVVLEKRGYAVKTACDGEEALEMAIADTPDLIITDVMMPNMDGWTLIKVLRARTESAFVPVIFLTALGSDADRIRGFRLGADDYLPKPFRFEELDLRVAKTVERTQQLETKARQQIGAIDTTSHALDANHRPPDFLGNLREVGISSLLVLMDMERKNGVLTITHEIPDTEKSVHQAEIILREGRPIAAKLIDKADMENSTLNNELAIYKLLNWNEGTFAFEAKETDCDVEIELTTTALLLEGARRTDERESVA